MILIGGPEIATGETENDHWKLSTWSGRLRAYLDMFFVDHGFVRYAYLNFHAVAPGVCRSAQPAPHHFRRFRQAGIRTIVNLRGGHGIAARALELEACERQGMAIVDLRLRSREAPDIATIERVEKLFDTVEYPILAHCKSGADRAGLFGALTVLIRGGGSAEAAREQLSLRYGHVRQGPTGILDAFIDAYAEAEASAEGRLNFMDWVRNDYDPAKLARDFKPDGWASWLIDKVLKRE